MRRLFIIWFIASILLFSNQLYGRDEANIVVPYTLADKERLIRVEEKVNSLEKRIDSIEKRIDSIDKRIDGLQGIVLGGFGILFSMMAVLIGFVLWDRRSTLAPVIRTLKEIERDMDENRKRFYDIVEILKEYSKKDEAMREILRFRGFL